MKKPDERRLRRSAARLHAVQALYQMEMSGQTAESVIREFEAHRFTGQAGDGATRDAPTGDELAGNEPAGEELAPADPAHFRSIIDEAVNLQARIDQLTDRALVAAWPIARIDPVLRALFRAGGAELVQGKTPPRVVITEYLEVARAFFPEGREPGFVNAVLDHMAREARPDAF